MTTLWNQQVKREKWRDERQARLADPAGRIRREQRKMRCSGQRRDETLYTVWLSSSIPNIMKNTLRKVRSHVETGPRSVIYNFMQLMNILNLCKARYSLTFIEDISENLEAFHLNAKTKAGEQLKHHIQRTNRHTEYSGKRMFLERGKEY